MTAKKLGIAFITGRSRPGNIALSPSQRAFLERVMNGNMMPVAENFPWIPQTESWRDTGLLRASINNARDYLSSRRPDFISRYRNLAITMLDTADHTLLLSGSCGLELFNNLDLPASSLSRVSLFAFGPVARKRPDCHHLLVQGRQDFISRLWFPRVDERLACGHMDYLSQPALVNLCKRFIHQIRK
ncbi:hypothetical protein [Atlantibacter hermannii]|uniref:hypothetical protein n=1 Tax=Atlantibacter hermannii TaxID=565 RepID=UPI0028A7C437|nr:hypothetical protein [Atlantibacter hermannii]